MTTQVLFVQGGGAGVHDEWDHQLVASLDRELGPAYAVRYPRMPNEGDPSYSAWKPALLDQLDILQNGAVLVGHSVGGTILIHALAEPPPKRRLGGLFLIAAPFIGEGGWPSDEIRSCTDFSQRLPADIQVFLYHGVEDDIVPFPHVHLYARSIPQAVVHALAHGNHQLNNDMSEVAQDIQALSFDRTS